MARYYRIVNVELKQCFSGHRLHCGIKENGVLGLPLSGMLAWLLLPPLADPRWKFMGTWAGHRVQIVADEEATEELYILAEETFEDISVPLFTEWANADFSRCWDYWLKGWLDDDGQLTPSGCRQDAAKANMSREFPGDKWATRLGLDEKLDEIYRQMGTRRGG